MDDSKSERSKKIGNLSVDENYCEDVFQEQHVQSPQKSKRARKFKRHTSGNQRLPSTRSTKMTSPQSAPTSKSSSEDLEHNIQLDETPSSTYIFISSRSLRSRTKCSLNLDALISPRKNFAVSSSPVVLDTNSSGGIVSRRSCSSLGEKSDAHFVSPPERVAGRVTRAHSKTLVETNTPSPDKRIVEIQTPTPTKRMKKTQERSSGRFQSKQESCKSKLRTSTDAKTLCKSPTCAQTQEKSPSVETSEESEPLTTLESVSKRKRKTIISSPEETMMASDSCKPKLLSSSLKSPSNVQTQESKFDEENVKESCGKITKTQGYSLVSSKDVQSASNEFDCSTETVSLGPSNSNRKCPVLHSKLRTSTDAKTLRKSPTCAQTQENRVSTEKIGESPTFAQRQEKRPSTEKIVESEPLTTPELVSKRKRKTIISSPEETETANDSYELSLSSDINIVQKSLSNLHLQESKLDVENVEESCVIITTIQDYSLVSSRDVQPGSIEFDSTAETQRLRPSNSGRMILNPHVFSAPSIIVDSGNETKTFKPSDPIPKFLNPQLHTTRHFPRQSNSIINTSRRKVIYETSGEKSKKNENQSVSSTVKYSTSRTTTHTSTFRTLGMLRRSKSDETLTSTYGQCGHSDSVIDSSSIKRSKSLSEIARDLDPQFLRILRRCTPTTALSSKNPLQFRTQSNQAIVGVTGNVCMDLSTARSNPFLQGRVRSISEDVSTSRNRQIRRSDIKSLCIDVKATTSKHEPSSDYSTVQPESSTSRNLPGGASNPPSVYIDLIEMESSTSSCQPLTTDDYGTTSDDQLDSSSDVPKSRKNCGRSRGAIGKFDPSPDEYFPVYDSEARLLLQDAMKEVLLYSKEDEQWKKIESLLLRFSQSSSKEDARDLYICLMTYLDSRKNDLWIKNMFTPRDKTIETYLAETFERLMTMVIGTFASTLSLRSCSDFDGIILSYQNFKTFHDIFSGYWENNKIEDMEDETSRNHLKEKIQRLLLVVQTAFQYFLAYIGKKAEQKSLAIYEDKLSEFDKKFLKRQN